MGTILCAIRGGEASRRTQEKAINIAKELGLALVFLYVIDEILIEKSDSRIRIELRDEITRMGRLLLRVARSRASKKGISAGFVIGQGTLREAIENCIRENKVELLILGCPKEKHDQKHFNMEQLEKFAGLIRESTGINVEIV